MAASGASRRKRAMIWKINFVVFNFLPFDGSSKSMCNVGGKHFPSCWIRFKVILWLPAVQNTSYFYDIFKAEMLLLCWKARSILRKSMTNKFEIPRQNSRREIRVVTLFRLNLHSLLKNGWKTNAEALFKISRQKSSTDKEPFDSEKVLKGL